MFSKYKDLIDEIENDTKSENRCMISHLDILPQNGITLDCNHCFRLEYLMKIKPKNICPYCSSSFSLEKKKIRCKYNNCSKDTVLDTGLCKKHSLDLTFNKCPRILKSGKRKGQPCNLKCKGLFCKRHIFKL